MLLSPHYSKFYGSDDSWQLIFYNLCSSISPLQLQYCAAFKRNLTDDLKPIYQEFTLKALFMQIFRATVLPMTMIVNEYNTFMIQQDQKEFDDGAEFDWTESLNRGIGKIVPTLQRNFSITINRKLMEQWALGNLPIKIVDKLTKNVDKSILRKLGKFGRLEACRRIFFTDLWGYSLLTLSNFTYDVYSDWGKISAVPEATEAMSSKIQTILIRILKKAGAYTTGWVFHAVGFAIGAYINTKWAAPAFSMVFDVVGHEAFKLIVL
jgi:hypothetical protein